MEGAIRASFRADLQCLQKSDHITDRVWVAQGKMKDSVQVLILGVFLDWKVE